MTFFKLKYVVHLYLFRIQINVALKFWWKRSKLFNFVIILKIKELFLIKNKKKHIVSKIFMVLELCFYCNFRGGFVFVHFAFLICLFMVLYLTFISIVQTFSNCVIIPSAYTHDL